jgi:hypothetical protein
MSFSMSVIRILDALRSGVLAELVCAVNAVATARGIGIAETWREVTRCLAPRPELEAQYREWAGADGELDWSFNGPAANKGDLIPQPSLPAPVVYTAPQPCVPTAYFADVEFAPNPRCGCGRYLPCGCWQS